MLLYAFYIPSEVTPVNRERLFAFASIESFVQAMGDYNFNGADLSPITHEFAKYYCSSIATLIHWNPETKYCEEVGTVWVDENTMTDNWDGKRKEIFLVERAADEKIVRNMVYA